VLGFGEGIALSREAKKKNKALSLFNLSTFPPAVSTAAARPLASSSPSTDALTRLPLCDCRPASAASGLACAREGGVVVGFAREGQWVAGGGGTVPLSPAVCCRVCLQEGEGEGEQPPGRASPVGVVSVNCRADAMACSPATGGLVAGFGAASPVPTLGPGVALPLGPPTCCTPALLLPDGAVLDTQPCDCRPAPHAGVSCGNGSDGRALRGFGGERVSLGGDAVPAGPAQCCRACVDAAVSAPAPRDCGAGGCGPHGACVRGGCACSPGWGGPGCAARARDGSDGWVALLEALFALAGALALLTVGAAVARGLVDAVRELVEVAAAGSGGGGGATATAGGAPGEEGEEGGAPLHEPLIVRLAGGAGSVGSVDTDGEEGEDAGSGEEGGGGDGAGPAPPGGGEEAEAEGGRGPPAPGATHPPPSPAPAAAAKEEDDPHPSTAGLPPGVGACVVCTARPIQAVAIPCGHACLCRRCARRLARCPVCRVDLVRRQRLFVGG